MNRLLFNHSRSLAYHQIQQLRLALRAYRLEKGTYPAKLAELSPGYLKKLPIDPFGAGEVWRYQKKGDSYRCWSLGPDLKNDGGRSIPLEGERKTVRLMQDSVGDFVARP